MQIESEKKLKERKKIEKEKNFKIVRENKFKDAKEY